VLVLLLVMLDVSLFLVLKISRGVWDICLISGSVRLIGVRAQMSEICAICWFFNTLTSATTASDKKEDDEGDDKKSSDNTSYDGCNWG
jgi:hypothetical protein